MGGGAGGAGGVESPLGPGIPGATPGPGSNGSGCLNGSEKNMEMGVFKSI